MSKEYLLSSENDDELIEVSKALSNPTRLRILKLLYYSSLSVNEIAAELKLPQSTTAVHIKSLEEAGLIASEAIPGNHGIKKICRRTKDLIAIDLRGDDNPDLDFSSSVSMPIGAFTDASIKATCGMCSATELLKGEDSPSEFFSPERLGAELLWSSSGFVEYRFPIPELYLGKIPKRVLLSFEACSEAPNYNENWPSDLTLWINGSECLSWTCPGDFGKRQGRLTPDWWNRGATQYGLLYSAEIGATGSSLNLQKMNDRSVFDFSFDSAESIAIRIGNKEDATNKGGFNLFGRSFGDYAQDIILTLVYPRLAK